MFANSIERTSQRHGERFERATKSSARVAVGEALCESRASSQVFVLGMVHLVTPATPTDVIEHLQREREA